METIDEMSRQREEGEQMKSSEEEFDTGKGQALLLERKKPTGGKRNPPARNTSRFWFERFLAVIQRQNPAIIDTSFLSQIAPSNEGKLLAQLKFLHVIDDRGKPTSLLSEVNMLGEEQRKGFQQVIGESYPDLLNEVKIEKALPDDLLNFFIRKYQFPRDKAVNAAKFFLYLAEKGAMMVSPELLSLLAEKNGANGSTGIQPRTSRPTEQSKSGSLLQISPPRISRKAIKGKNPEKPPFHTTINITLDKDTPREYWDRVLALLGEEKQEQEESNVSDKSLARDSLPSDLASELATSIQSPDASAEE